MGGRPRAQAERRGARAREEPAGVRRRAPALHPLHVGLDRKAEGRAPHDAPATSPARTSRRSTSSISATSDLYWCTADVGWVTGHSYIVYGPLSSGATCMMYEGAPNFPDWGRFWSIIEKHGVTILYTAPTAIRAFIRAGRRVADEARPLEPAPPRHRSASRSTPRRGSGTTASSAAAAAPSSTRGGRPRPARS